MRSAFQFAEVARVGRGGPGDIVRTTLIERFLAEGAGVVVTAPRGFGKRTLARQLGQALGTAEPSPTPRLRPRGGSDVDLPEPSGMLRVGPVSFSRHPGEFGYDYASVVTARELCFDDQEMLSLVCQHLHEEAPVLAQLLLRATGGWPALVSAYLAVLAPLASAERLDAVVRHATNADLLNRMLGQSLRKLSRSERTELATVASEPSFSMEVFAAACGVDALERFIDAGVPICQRSDGELELFPIAAEALRSIPFCPLAAKRMAPVLRASGAPLRGVRLLVRVGEREEALNALCSLTRTDLDTIAPLELLGLCEILRPLGHEQPALYLLQARVLRAIGHLDDARRSLTAVLADAFIPPGVRREAEAELDIVEASRGYDDALLERIAQHQSAVPADEVATAAMLNVARGLCLANHPDLQVVVDSELPLLLAARQWESLGEWAEAARTLRMYAMQTLGELVRFQDVQSVMERAMQMVGPVGAARLRCLVALCRSAADTGHLDAFRGYHAEADLLARTSDRSWAVAYLHWSMMTTAGWERDPTSALSSHAAAANSLGPLRGERTGVLFLAESAEAFARVGVIDLAQQMLSQAAAHPLANTRSVEFAQLALHAALGRSLDARRLAEELLAEGRVSASRRWRVLADVVSADWRAARSVDEKLWAQLTREVTASKAEAQLDLALPDDFRAGPAAPQPTLRVGVFGGLTISRSGVLIELTDGHPATLVKLLAVRHGNAPVDMVIETIWPEIEPALGRRRLKNVVQRVRQHLGDGAIVRTMAAVSFGLDVEVDLSRFEDLSRSALANRGHHPAVAAQCAREAIAICTGPVLPSDAYDDWVNEARDRAAARLEAMFDVLSDGADA